MKRPPDVRAHLKRFRQLDSSKLAVVDKGGQWMERWRNQFKALGIKYLRSHEMMHPDAFDHSSLSVWASAKKRQDFLFLEDLPKNRTYHGPFVLPSNCMMLDFCRDLVKQGRLEKNLWSAEAESMRRCQDGMEVTLRSEHGSTQIFAHHVVVARGPTCRPQWPGFYGHLDPTSKAHVYHAWDLFDDPGRVERLKGRGLIVGGGLSSAHLCAQLAARGPVELLIRRERRVKQYDLGLSWMGLGRRDHRREYEQAPVGERMKLNKEARDGGSMSPELDVVVRDLEAQGRVRLREHTEVVTAAWDGHWTVVLSSGDSLEADYLICATGARVDVCSDPLLRSLQEAHPLKLHHGLPELTHALQWGDLPVYLMGNLAALELGPDAVNMSGAVRGALRICNALGLASRNLTKNPKTTGKSP